MYYIYIYLFILLNSYLPGFSHLKIINGFLFMPVMNTHTVHNYADDHFKISSLAIHFAFASISEYSPYRGHNPP